MIIFFKWKKSTGEWENFRLPSEWMRMNANESARMPWAVVGQFFLPNSLSSSSCFSPFPKRNPSIPRDQNWFKQTRLKTINSLFLFLSDISLTIPKGILEVQQQKRPAKRAKCLKQNYNEYLVKKIHCDFRHKCFMLIF